MIEHHLQIPTQAGQMNAFVTHPDEGGPFPVVFFYMDAPGKREELHDMARRIATTGYVVVLPNLYYRKTQEFVWDQSEEAMKAMFEMTKHLSLECIMEDTKAMFDFIDNFPLADASRIGAVGYCMSGPFVFKAAGRYPERIACAASPLVRSVALNGAAGPSHWAVGTFVVPSVLAWQCFLRVALKKRPVA